MNGSLTMENKAQQPTKILLQAELTQCTIGSSSKHQQSIINLASVIGWHGAIIPACKQ